MTSTTKNQPAGPLHTLKSAFKEIFGKQNDTQKSAVPAREEKSDSSERENFPR